MLVLEFQDQMDAGDFVHHAEFDGFRRTEKILRFGGVARPDTVFFEVLARLFLLKQNLHRYGNVSSIMNTQPGLFGSTTTNCA